MLTKTNAKGMACLDEPSAKELLDQLSDGELEKEILFNTPEDAAEILSEVGAP